MQGTPYATFALEDEPSWPDGGGPFVFLLEHSGSVEEKLLEGWIARNTPADTAPGAVQRATLPQTRRRPRRRSLDPRLGAFLQGGGDPLLVPMRVSWLPSQRDGERKAGWRDVVSFGDPRDPDRVRQHVIYRTRPDRVRVVMGTPGRLSELRRRWEESGVLGRLDGTGFVEFTALRAWLALERAERELRGSRYKVPKFPRESLMHRPGFAQGVAVLAQEAGASYDHMAARTKRYVREIAATHSPFVIDLVTGGFRWLISKAYVAIDYDEGELEALYAMSRNHPLVFLPSHKSNFDHLILQDVLYRNRLPPNHTAGGINMNFFPVGPILRRSGVFFIRREFKDNEPYKFVLRQYLDYLLEKRFPLEWYIEGGRSRTGKLRTPRYGLLAYVVDSFRRGSTDDVILIPVAIAYDQIQDVGGYAAEQTGGGKEKESFGWMVRVIRSLRRRYGDAHLRFGSPIGLRGFLADQPDPPEDADDTRSPAIPKLAFEIAVRLNNAMPITPISLVTLALLSAHGRALTLAETMAAIEPHLEFVRARDLPMTEKLDLTDASGVTRALAALEAHGVVAAFQGPAETVYRIGPEQHHAAAYYRNTIVHHFVPSAIAELALAGLLDDGPVEPGAVVAGALRLRDLLKFEFFFAPTDEFAQQIGDELTRTVPGWEATIADQGAAALLGSFEPFRSHVVLRPFLEAYQVVGDLVARHAVAPVIDAGDLASAAGSLGQQYVLQGRIENRDAVSSVLFGAAVSLAANRRLLAAEPDSEERRLEFGAEIRSVLADIERVAAMAAARLAGIV
jgi:glycerol-3-phosphate O-acyltransferase